jgi:hypothetical protein
MVLDEPQHVVCWVIWKNVVHGVPLTALLSRP